MSLLKKIFGKKEEAIHSYADFWNWFQKNEQDFQAVVRQRKDIEKKFFDIVSPKLAALKDGFYLLTGVDNDTVELIFTADGNVKNMVFIEELVQAAPPIAGWRFIAHKSPTRLDGMEIRMGDLSFNSDNLFFYSNDNPQYPDVIDISIVHKDFTEENKAQVGNGTFIFLDNYLGEISFASNIDEINVTGSEAGKELIPIHKLQDFITWRQKEFVEKYDGVQYDTSNDSYSMLEATLKGGYPLIAIVNTNLLNWDSKASHPWMSVFTIGYKATKTGMPDGNMELLNKIEEDIMQELKDVDGYLNAGRQTAKGARDIYFACKDFRKPAKVFHAMQQKYAGSVNISYDIYKDKYWQTLERFNVK